MTSPTRQRTYAALLAFGGALLVFRAVAMLVSGASTFLVPWVVGLLFAELTLDVAAVLACLRWWAAQTERSMQIALRLAAAVALIHAVRVGVFIAGRTGPWVDFDVLPDQRAQHPERWTWAEVYFAGTVAALAVLAVLIVWRRRRGTRRSPAT